MHIIEELVIHRGCDITQGQLQILGLQERAFCGECGSIRVCRQQLENAADGDPHAPDAGLASALPRFNRDAIKKIHRGHVSNAGYRAREVTANPSCRLYFSGSVRLPTAPVFADLTTSRTRATPGFSSSARW